MAAPCAQCGYAHNDEHASACALCGVLRVRPEDDPFRVPRAAPAEIHAPTRTIRVPVGWVHLGGGLLLALLLTLTPTLRFMGWLLGSLFHETGHVAFAWFVGCPAWPAISLAGHAAAIHKPQSGGVLFVVGLLLAIGAWQAWRAKRFRGLAFSALAVWPILAFFETPRDLGFLLSGHLGELTFAGVFLWRARTGNAIERESERPVYAALGWFLVARNVVLAFGLVFSESARAWYHSSGSFGLTNDYIRVAQHVLHVPLETVAVFMLLVSLGVVPLVLAMTWAPKEIRLPRPPPPKPADSMYVHRYPAEREPIGIGASTERPPRPQPVPPRTIPRLE